MSGFTSISHFSYQFDMKSHKHQGFFSVDMKNKRYTVILKATLLGGTTFQLSTNLSISSCCSIYALRLTANSKTKEASINFDLKLVLYSFFLHFFCVFFLGKRHFCHQKGQKTTLLSTTSKIATLLSSKVHFCQPKGHFCQHKVTSVN